MSIVVEQAIYGERKGAHALLVKSSQQGAPFAVLANHTDRPGNSPSQLPWDPFIRGFPFGDYYVVAKTFPDPDASRGGMVYTHALVVELATACGLDDLSVLLRLLPDAIVRSPEVSSVLLSAKDVLHASQQPCPSPPGLHAVVHALLTKDVTNKPVVWVGEEGFIDVTCALWQHLWPEARATFAFRLGFSPQDVEGQDLALVATPESIENRWSGRGFALVHRSDVVTEITPSASLLLGLPEGDTLRQLRDTLGATMTWISDLRHLERCQLYLDSIPNGKGVDEVRSIARQLGTFSPNPALGMDIKRQVLLHLAHLTEQGTASDVKALRNFDVAPFPNGAVILGEAIVSWIGQRTLEAPDPVAGETADLLVRAFSSPETLWGNAVTRSIKSIVERWDRGVPVVLWQWWQEQNTLVDNLIPFVPTTTDGEFILAEHCPQDLAPELGVRLLSFARIRSWYVLHAVVAIASLAPAVAFQRQTDIDREPHHLEGFRAMAVRVPDDTLIDVALMGDDVRLALLSGESCARNPSLLHRLDIQNERWRCVWRCTMDAGGEPFAGVPHPQGVMFALMDLVLQGVAVEPALLTHLVQTPSSDLSDYPRRRELWQRLEGSILDGFLNVTAHAWLERFAVDPSGDPDLEPLLEGVVRDDTHVTMYLNRHGNQPALILRLFERFPQLSEGQFIRWLSTLTRTSPYGSMRPQDVQAVGEYIATRQWRETARRIADNAATRDDFSPAVAACQHLLSLVDRWKLHRQGKGWGVSPSISEGLWWQELVDIACQLYPSGPAHDNIWDRAGGKLSDVFLSATGGRTSWEHALRTLRYGGGGKHITSKKLVAEMLDQYHRNETLMALHSTVPKG